jgi:RNA polymerase sigma-70 factor (ECF subfamily)
MTERVERSPATATAATVAALGDSELVTLARRGDAAAFREIMRRNSRQLFRAARAILRDDVEAEALQEVYLRAFQGLAGFRGESSLSTWLTRIALNEALGRLRQRRAVVAMEVLDVAAGERQGALISPLPTLSRDGCSDPEGAAGRNEVRRSLRQAIEELPEPFRVVFVLRDVKEASVEKTAVLLGLRPETVRTRLHRARRMLRASLDGLGKEVGPIPGGPDGVRRPSIVLSARDHKHLIELAGTAAKHNPQVARLLMEETGRADVVSAEQLPMDVAAVGSLVKFHDAVSQVTQRVQLALPAAANIGEGRISVLSLVGAGLIGLATGQSIDWPTQGGRMRRLSVLRVDPAERSAAARFPRPPWSACGPWCVPGRPHARRWQSHEIRTAERMCAAVTDCATSVRPLLSGAG